MQIIYYPADLPQAQMLVTMLDSEGIVATIGGANLLGGIGMLPTNDLLTMLVNDIDVNNAKNLINSYLAASFDEPLE